MKLREKAVAYWQDKLAKFFPTSKGPTGVELDMYKAGLREGLKLAAEVVRDCGASTCSECPERILAIGKEE